MKFKRFTFGPFRTNTYVLFDEKNVILVDCAAYDEDERMQLSEFLEKAELRPTLLVCTHGHLDHLWGAKWACEKYGLTAYIHPDDYEQIENLAQQQLSFGIAPRETDFPYADLTKVFPFYHSSVEEEAEGIFLIHTPGHTRGSVCLYLPKDAMLLSGDTLFVYNHGRTDLPGGSEEAMMASLERLSKLPPNTDVLSGHGGYTNIYMEF